MSNAARTLYVGVTNNIERRVHHHKLGTTPGFTSKYRVGYLVHYEQTTDVYDAITREKQFKDWTRAKKVALIEAENPDWHALSVGWYSNDSAARSVDPSLRSG